MRGTYSLSPVERRLVQYLTLNGVKPEKEIAADLRLNPATISYKLKKLEKNGALAEYRYRINYSKIGLGVMAWVFFKMYRSNVAVEDFLDKLLEQPNIYAALNLTGSDDFAIKIFAGDLSEVTQSVIDLEKKFKHLIKSSSINFVSKDFKRHQVVLGEKHRRKTKLSKLDIKLLLLALKKPRASLKELASELKIHRNTVGKRWQKLFDEGVILKKSSIVSPEHFEDVNISFRAVVSYIAKTGETERLAEELAKLPEVHELAMTTSQYNIITVVRTRDLDGFYQFHKRFYEDPAFKGLVENSISSLILKGRTQSLSKVMAKMEQAL